MRRRNTSSPRRNAGALVAIVLVLAGAAVWAAWGALRQGEAPAITVTSERPAIGQATAVAARFTSPEAGLGGIRLELVQGDRVEVLAERRFPRASAFNPLARPGTTEAVLDATVGRSKQEWLTEGEAVLRASADRLVGPLRSGAPVVVESRIPVRLRPPRLEVLSRQHYLRQGGSGMVVFRAGEGTVRSGVRAGEVESLSFPRPGGGPGERFALFAVPWSLRDGAGIRVFAEDGAGNRAEAAFVDLYKPAPGRRDRIEVSDAFLERVVPAISSQTPGLDTTGTLLEQYLRINGEVRRANLAEVRTLTAATADRFLWSGPFRQMPNTQTRANFAETRTYVYGGRPVDEQTHLGLDLASTAGAPVPAANAGRVVYAGWLAIYGNVVVLDHGYGLASLYGHMSAIDVAEGAEVTQGQAVGRSGASGLAGGDHLHLEIFVQGQSVQPLEWLDQHWLCDNLATKMPVPGC